jgi:type IV pilus assembly protein PilE
MRRYAGFTLIEVMIVVAIVGILATVGYPAYTDYLRRGKVAEVVSTLAEARAKLEQYFLDNRTYIGADGANFPCNPTVLNAGKKHFTYSCTNLGTGTYDINASGQAAEGMSGFTYTLNQANVRSSTVTGVSGWSGNATCWVTKKGGVC